MHRPIFASVFVAAFLLIGGMREVWAIDWGECQRTGFSELKPEIVIPSCSQIIETGKASEEDLAIAYFRRGRGCCLRQRICGHDLQGKTG